MSRRLRWVLGILGLALLSLAVTSGPELWRFATCREVYRWVGAQDRDDAMVTLDLEPRAWAAGRVVDEKTRPLAGWWVATGRYAYLYDPDGSHLTFDHEGRFARIYGPSGSMGSDAMEGAERDRTEPTAPWTDRELTAGEWWRAWREGRW